VTRLKKEVSQHRSTNTATDHYRVIYVCNRTLEMSFLVCMVHASYLCANVIEMNAEKLYIIRHIKQTLIMWFLNITWREDKQWTVKGIVICFGIIFFSASNSRTRPWFVMFWRVSAVWQWLTSYSSSNCEIDSGFQTGGVNPYAIFTILHTQLFLSLLNPKRRSTWTSLRIGCGCKGSGAWL